MTSMMSARSLGARLMGVGCGEDGLAGIQSI